MFPYCKICRLTSKVFLGLLLTSLFMIVLAVVAVNENDPYWNIGMGFLGIAGLILSVFAGGVMLLGCAAFALSEDECGDKK